MKKHWIPGSWGLWVIGTAMVAVLVGCGPYRASHVSESGVYATEKVILLDRNLDPWILPERVQVIEAHIEKDANGSPQVRVELTNRRTKPTSMEMRTVFKDMGGLPVHTTSWEPAVVPGNATYSYAASCPNKDAVDFQVQVKSLK